MGIALTTERAVELIYQAVDEINPTLPANARVAKSPETVLYGPGGALDSLGLVNLVVAVEEALANETGLLLTLADQRAMSRRKSPFRTIAVLAEYICELAKEPEGG